MSSPSAASTIVLVTGANRGIGLALTAEFLRWEYQVVATARNLAQAGDLRRLQEIHPAQLRLVTLEVNSDESATRLAASLPSVDLLVNNAAIFPEEGEETVEQWQTSHLTAAFETNVVGVARVTQALLPHLQKSSAARVVNISSTAGSISGKHTHFYYAYSVSKAALNMLTRAMAFDLKRHGITVVAVTPGWVQTEMGGSDATLTPQECARDLVEMMGHLQPEQAGQFLERDGRPCRYAW